MIGQLAAVEILKAVIVQKKYGSAYLFSGLSGIGKTTIARIFAKAILCDSPENGDPCDRCPSCALFENEQHFGYIELDSASVGGKEDMIKLRDEAAFLSIAKKKLILLDECHDISKQGQDALLDQVERCPEHLIYLFCTTEPDKLRDPLRARCMHFQFLKVDSDLIFDRLKIVCTQENFKYEEEALRLMAQRSEGHVRNAINLLEEVVYLGAVTVNNVNVVSRDFDDEIYTIIANLGIDLSKVLEAYKKVSDSLSSMEFYNQLLSMVNDAAKFQYGYKNCNGKRLSLMVKLKDIHGGSIMEFLNYLITRDKFVDKVGLQSDLIVLHYKFSSNNFAPKTVVIQKEVPQNIAVPQIIPTQIKEVQNAPPSLSYTDLSKLNILERGNLLRQRRNQKLEQKKEEATVPRTWPLPKDERIGESSLDEVNLSPEEFSRRLVGGRDANQL